MHIKMLIVCAALVKNAVFTLGQINQLNHGKMLDHDAHMQSEGSAFGARRTCAGHVCSFDGSRACSRS
jgi:hypothetical protein